VPPGTIARMNSHWTGAENQAVSVASQASNPASALCSFLDAMLPQRGLVAEEWARQAREAPWSAVEVDADRQRLAMRPRCGSGWT
jgi:hypothetical protein